MDSEATSFPAPVFPTPVQSRRSVLSWLYNHNPFYVISACLMLFAVRSLYREQAIGEINCWMMMTVLSAYTALLAGVSISIVRWGQVWEDARSLLVVILLLFLAISVSADDLFASMESSTAGSALMFSGYLFSAIVTETILWLSGLRLRAGYRVPLHLFLILFFFAPWWCSPELHSRSSQALEWTIFAFPICAAALLLMLLPAVRRGPDYANSNGSPWRWPLYPWTAFLVLAVAASFRSFALAMTFGPSGPIWIEGPSSSRMISFDTIWGTYFLIPIVFAGLLLLFEGALASDNRRIALRAMRLMPFLMILALPFNNGPVAHSFLRQVTATLGSPLWLTLCLLTAFYAWAIWRKMPHAEWRLGAAVALFSLIGPESTGLATFHPFQLGPLVTSGLFLLSFGIWRRSAWTTFAGTGMLSVALGVWLSDFTTPRWSLAIGYHAAWLSLIAVGFLYRKDGNILQDLGAFLMLAMAYVAFNAPALSDAHPDGVLLAYVATLTIISGGLALAAQRASYRGVFCILDAASGYLVLRIAFLSLANIVELRTLSVLSWSGGSLIIAVLISSHKAKWLPPGWFVSLKPTTPPTVPPAGPSVVTPAPSPDVPDGPASDVTSPVSPMIPAAT